MSNFLNASPKQPETKTGHMDSDTVKRKRAQIVKYMDYIADRRNMPAMLIEAMLFDKFGVRDVPRLSPETCEAVMWFLRGIEKDGIAVN